MKRKEERCMCLGETIEEKRESYELLTRRAKKLGKFFAVLGGLAGIVLGLCLMFAKTDNKIAVVIFGFFIMIIAPITYYWAGYLWFYGFITVKSWFAKLGVGVVGATATAGNSIAISYLLGGKKTAKLTGIIWLIALGIILSIGFYVGLYNFLKIRAEVKKLGIV